MIKVGIHGSRGRVGRLLIENLDKDQHANPAVLYAIDAFSFTPPKEAIITDIVN